MRIEYNKLVRDRIPEIIRKDGRTCATKIMSEEEYRTALREKLVEEAEEVVQADPEHLVTELADILEIIDAIVDAYRLEHDTVSNVQARRRTERGAFNDRIRLLWTD